MQSKAENKLKIKIGTLISSELFKYYLQLSKLEYGVNEENNKYLFNLTDGIEKKMETLIKNVSRDLLTLGIPQASVEQQAQDYFNLVYTVLNLDLKDQNRVLGLVDKLKKEEAARTILQ